MAKIIPFPKRRHRVTSRAANLTSKSVVTPAPRPTRDLVTFDHHQAGIESRCHHFDTDVGSAPTSAAMESRDGHSSITSRKECMLKIIRQFVLRRKAGLSKNQPLDHGGQNVLSSVTMSHHKLSDDEFRKNFTARIKMIREAKGWSQEQMAKLLDIDQGTYHKYEGRTLMPHKLLLRFCYETGVDLAWVYCGPAIRRDRKPRDSRKAS